MFGNSTKYEDMCSRDHPKYPTAMFKQGSNLYNLKTATQQLLCHNPEDDETLMVYFACCNNDCECVDPVVTPGADDDTTTDIASSASTSTGGSGDVTLAAVVASSVVSTVVGVASYHWAMPRKNSNIARSSRPPFFR